MLLWANICRLLTAVSVVFHGGSDLDELLEFGVLAIKNDLPLSECKPVVIAIVVSSSSSRQVGVIFTAVMLIRCRLFTA